MGGECIMSKSHMQDARTSSMNILSTNGWKFNEALWLVERTVTLDSSSVRAQVGVAGSDYLICDPVNGFDAPQRFHRYCIVDVARLPEVG